ncbi:MAG: DNA repair protein [Methylocystaceae bacterium]|nr:MAG: DNA repair protein [Methylocystaceae bacterium]
MTVFFTIGHSTRSIETLIDLLRNRDIRLLIDVRSVPRSRTNPQFNADTLPGALAKARIGYERIAELGGLRGAQKAVPPELNAFWRNAGFHNFADYAMSESFSRGFATLRELGRRSERCAIMCAEALWWRCHRRIIADYLIAAGEKVVHIVGPDHDAPGRLTEAARPGPDGRLTYPAQPRQGSLCFTPPPDEDTPPPSPHPPAG